MTNTVTDAIGIPASVGDTVVFAQGQRGVQKMRRLSQWCQDATEASKDEGGARYGFVYVDQESFEQHKPTTFAGLVNAFREYQDQKQEA